MKRLLILFFVLATTISQAQIDQTELVISKIDAFDQFTLWDNSQIRMMGYTQTLSAPIDIPSPTLTFNSGDSVRLDMWNLSQGPPHTIHLHGLDVDQANDGVPAFSQSIHHDDTGSYYFKAPHPGTYIYHCHVMSPIHVQAGMYGMVIVKPADGSNNTWDGGFAYDSEYSIMTSEIDTNWHVDSIIMHDYMNNASTTAFPDYHPQYFMINGRSDTQLYSHSIDKTVNETVFLRTANIGNLGNRFILPAALNPQTISSDGRPLPSFLSSDTIEVLPGERYGTIFEANSEFTDSIVIEYFDLNTGLVENTQYLKVTIEGTFGLGELDHNTIMVYPNPASDLITVELPFNSSQLKEVYLIDAFGKRTHIDWQNNANQINMDISNISGGIYLLTVIDHQKSYTQKLILTHNSK